VPINPLSEPEVTYQIDLFKQKMQKNKNRLFMRSLHERAMYTVKVLTVQTVESHQPIMHTLSKYDTVNKENVRLLLYRCQRMY